MRRSKPNPPAAHRNDGETASRTATICIVDCQPSDFHPTFLAVRDQGAVAHCVTSASDGLRLSRAEPVDLWVINTDLPDHAGSDLCGMLRQRHPRTAIFLMADCPTAELERAAWAARSTLFGARSAHGEWIEQWLEQRHRRHVSDAGQNRDSTAATEESIHGSPPSASQPR